MIFHHLLFAREGSWRMLEGVKNKPWQGNKAFGSITTRFTDLEAIFCNVF